MSRSHDVLVVEDNDDDFETVVEALRHTGLANQIRRAVSGTQCVAQMREGVAHPSSLPAFVLLDLNTPNDDGRDALLQIKADDALRLIPVVVISASLNPRDIDFCYRNGIGAYHIKSVNHATHLETLQKIFSYWLVDALLPTGRSLEK